MDSANELSPTMKPFAWRGLGTKITPEEAVSSAPGIGPTVNEAEAPVAPSSSVIEIRLAGVMVRIMPGTDTTLLTEVLRAVQRSDSKPVPTSTPVSTGLPRGFFGPR